MVERSVMELSEAICGFLAYQQARKGRTDSTISTYRSSLQLFAKWAGNIMLSDLSPALVDKYANHLVQYNFAQKTFRNKLTPIRSMVKHYYGKGEIDMRPESIDLPPTLDTEANFLTHEEQIDLVRACKTPREKALILLLVRSGVRVTELINIKTDDPYDRSIIIRFGKGKKHRIVFIAHDADDAIRAYHASLPSKPQYLICGETGKQLSRQYVARVIATVSRRAKITKNVSPHTLRHTCATNMLRDGVGIENVQKILGHANIQTTLIYLHFTNDYLKSKYDQSATLALA